MVLVPPAGEDPPTGRARHLRGGALKGIVFLDRDGTLIEEMGYLSDPSLLKEIPGAAESLYRLAREGYVLAVVSNQAGVARGKFREDQMEAVHRAFVEYFRARGVELDAVEYCPHPPEGVGERDRRGCGGTKPHFWEGRECA